MNRVLPIYFQVPEDSRIRAFLAGQRSQAFTYSEVGVSQNSQAPAGYQILRERIDLGFGFSLFERAKQAVRDWKMFDFPWIKLFWPNTPLEPGREVAILARACNLYFLNACRIVYVIDTEEKFGFGYGTLHGHVESGEERFLIERNPANDSVSYEIFSFSRPGKAIFQIANPYIKTMQKRFIRDSFQAMRRAVAGRSSA